jgi:plastocyanin
MSNWNSKQILAVAGIAAAGIFVAMILGTQALMSIASAQDQTGAQMGNETQSPSWLFKVNNKYEDYENGVLRVRAGVGNHVAPLTWYFPQHAQIKTGETVVWYNPTAVGEPHTVTFVNDPATFAPIEAPFVIANGTQFKSIDPSSNAEPLLVPGPNGTQLAVMNNARSTMPVVMKGSDVQYLAPNGNYTMAGDEDYLNSGWIWPEGQTPEGLPEIYTFSVKFEQPGTYNYICLIHPWMTGSVTVS